MLTKKMIMDGSVTPVKQCMPEGKEIYVETIDLDNEEAAAVRAKRFIFPSFKVNIYPAV